VNSYVILQIVKTILIFRIRLDVNVYLRNNLTSKDFQIKLVSEQVLTSVCK
jgi:hypothetical protein